MIFLHVSIYIVHHVFIGRYLPSSKKSTCLDKKEFVRSYNMLQSLIRSKRTVPTSLCRRVMSQTSLLAGLQEGFVEALQSKQPPAEVKTKTQKINKGKNTNWPIGKKKEKKTSLQEVVEDWMSISFWLPRSPEALMPMKIPEEVEQLGHDTDGIRWQSVTWLDGVIWGRLCWKMFVRCTASVCLFTHFALQLYNQLLFSCKSCNLQLFESIIKHYEIITICWRK